LNRKAVTVQNQTEEEIRKLTQFLNLVVDNANVWLDVLDEKANVLIWNKAAEKISGYSRGEVVGHSEIWEWLYPDEKYRKEVFDSALSIIKGAATDEEAETKIRTKSGEYKIMSWYGRNLVDENGVPIGSVAIGRDITERKLVEEALRESEAKYSALVEQAKDVVAIVQDGVCRFVNSAATEVSGFAVEEIVDKPFLNWLTPESRDLVAQRYKLRMAGEKVPPIYEAKIQCKDGAIKDLEISAGVIQYNGRPADLAIARDVTERKRMGEELRQSEEKFRRIAANIEDVLYSVDGETEEFRYVSPALERLLGYTLEDIRQMGGRRAFLSQVIQGGEFAEQDRNFERLRTQRGVRDTPDRYQTWWRCKDGSLKCLEDRWIPVYEGERLVSTDGVLRDITERKGMEAELEKHAKHLEELVEERAKELRATKDRLQFLLSSSPAMIYTSKPYGDLGSTFISENFKDILGYEPRELLENPSFWIDHVHPKDRQRMHEEELRVIKEGNGAYEYRFQHKDGTYRWMREEARLIRDAAGNPLEVIGYWIDITNRKQTEEALSRLASIVESSDDAIYSYTLDGTIITSWNLGAERIYGHSGAEIKGQPASILVPSDRPDEIPGILERIRLGERIDHYETLRIRKDGKRIYVSLSVSPIKDADGEVIGASTIARDVTERRRIEDELKERTETIVMLNESISKRLLQKISQIDNIATVRERLRKSPDVSIGLDLILDTALTDLDMDVGAVLVSDREENTAKARCFKSRIEGVKVNERYPLDAGFIELEATKKNKCISKTVGQGESSIIRTATVHCAPILFGKEIYGILILGSQNNLILDNSDLAVLELYSELASTLFEMQSLAIVPVKEVAKVGKRRFELDFGCSYLVRNNVEKAFEVFADNVLSGLEGLCITREFPPKVRRKYGLERTPIVWLTHERAKDQRTVDSLQDLSVLIGNFLEKAKRGVVLLDGFEYLITNSGFEPFIRFLQLNRSRFEQHDSIFMAPLLEEAFNVKELKLIERETKPFIDK